MSNQQMRGSTNAPGQMNASQSDDVERMNAEGPVPQRRGKAGADSHNPCPAITHGDEGPVHGD